MTRRLLSVVAILSLIFFSPSAIAQNTYRDNFLNPTEENRSIIIWQWMDGLVTKEGITKDLEAFKEAGLAGVQNFQIGGDMQCLVGNPANDIGSDNWKSLMRWAMEECDRLRLSFGTHNCPGWSSSAYPNITPEYSMQKVVFSETKVSALDIKNLHKNKFLSIKLTRPEVDTVYNYYEDIAVLAMPDSDVVGHDGIINLSEFMSEDGELSVTRHVARLLADHPVVLRFGHTTNGATNDAQSPKSGQGLECDKMRREAVKLFWEGYPAMLLEIAGTLAGKTFTTIEIDSYEAGGQDWSVVLPEEFEKRKGYGLIPYLPAIVGRATIDSLESTRRFISDFSDVLSSLFAENYYEYLSELVAGTPGMLLLIEPYGTGGQKPFRVIDMQKIIDNTPAAEVATEFWVRPDWGWKDMAYHETVMRANGRRLLVAEAFTCWPLHAWKDDPRSLKPICDKAYCTGVNRMMLHAGATNPWLQVEPGMSFGIWGTQFVPAQTWWKAGGARVFFDYMARCQSLLQRGVPSKEQVSLSKFRSYRRSDGDNDILFICNPSDTVVTDTISLASLACGRYVEIWDPYTLTMEALPLADSAPLDIEPNGSRFLVITKVPLSTEPWETSSPENLLLTAKDAEPSEIITVSKGWKLEVPSLSREQLIQLPDTLFDWTSSPMPGLKFFFREQRYIPQTLLCRSGRLKREKLSLTLEMLYGK